MADDTAAACRRYVALGSNKSVRAGGHVAGLSSIELTRLSNRQRFATIGEGVAHQNVYLRLWCDAARATACFAIAIAAQS